MTRHVLAAAALLLAAPAAPQAERIFPPPGDCRDDRGVDRCAPGQQERVRRLFGVKTIEEHQSAGDQVRRVFYVDGYGRDVVAIEFLRPKGADPLLRVHFPAEEGEARVPPLIAAVDEASWNALLRRSAHFDRALPPQGAEQIAAEPKKRKATRRGEPPEEVEFLMCMHSWVYTAEATDPAEDQFDSAKVRRRTEDACDNGLTEAFAQEVQTLAVSLLPYCALLDPRQHRNDAKRLSACRILRGDRMAAAKVFNAWAPFGDADDPESAALLRSAFAYKAEIVWGGEPRGEARPEDFWIRKQREAKADGFYIEEVFGESPQRVRVTGRLYRAVGEGKNEAAPVEQIWVEDGGDYEVESATVGPFAPIPRQ